VTEVDVALLRLPAPDAGERDQLTPFCPGSNCTVAVNVWVEPAETVAELGAIVTTLAGTVRVAESDADGLVTEVAVMVTMRSLGGGLAGGLYATDVLVMLLSVPAPEAGEMLHVTPR
jgi:hypothetical protein